MKPTKEQLEALARLALHTRPAEVGSCEESLHLIGRLAEVVLSGEVVPPELEPVTQHLRVCPDCTEEFEALRIALEG